MQMLLNKTFHFVGALLIRIYSDDYDDLVTSRRANTQTIHIRQAGLIHSHLPYIINHHETTGVASCDFTTEWLHKF